MRKNIAKSKGFTLIEMVLVIALISILSGVVLSVINVKGIKQKSRDALRVADIKKIQTSLELYFADYRGYPSTGGNWEKVGSGGAINVLKTGNYINQIPVDPLNNSTDSSPCNDPTGYRYNYLSSGNTYLLTSIMEITSSNDGHECTSLSGWPGGCTGTQDVCYGVANPL